MLIKPISEWMSEKVSDLSELLRYLIKKRATTMQKEIM